MGFSDVNENDWFYDAAVYVVTNGLYKGTTATTFSPNTEMTHAMMVTVLWRLAGEPEVELVYGNFADVAQGSYYEKAVAWAAKNNIVTGYGEGFFGPDDPITREQLATIIYRYKGNPESAEKIPEFKDADKLSA